MAAKGNNRQKTTYARLWPTSLVPFLVIFSSRCLRGLSPQRCTSSRNAWNVLERSSEAYQLAYVRISPHFHRDKHLSPRSQRYDGGILSAIWHIGLRTCACARMDLCRVPSPSHATGTRLRLRRPQSSTCASLQERLETVSTSTGSSSVRQLESDTPPRTALRLCSYGGRAPVSACWKTRCWR